MISITTAASGLNMSILRRLALGLAACFGVGCGSRTYQEQRLLDPHDLRLAARPSLGGSDRIYAP